MFKRHGSSHDVPAVRLHAERGTLLAGKYELLELAGAGGMAEVFRGVTHGAGGFRRVVAIKRVLDSLSNNPEFVAMFVEEARVGSEVQHPNVVQIHDFDLDSSGRYFLVMEWIDGLTLNDFCYAYEITGKRTPWPLVAAVGIEVLKALGAAHERRDADGKPIPVFHRDVTPSNVLIGKNGVVKLSDFGLARATDRARTTQPHVLKGKLSYVAPEMIDGHDPSAASDLFSLGVVLFETLAQRKLFVGDSPIELLRAVKAAEVPPLGREDVPDELIQVVRRALSRDPAERYASARSMARALANILRMTPQSTGADVLGRAVVEAEKVLAGRRAAERE